MRPSASYRRGAVRCLLRRRAQRLHLAGHARETGRSAVVQCRTSWLLPFRGLGPGDRLPEHAFEVPDLPLKLAKTPRILLRAEAADFLPFLVEHPLQFRALHDWEASA